MNNIPGISREEAYDLTRKEFYLLRQEEDIERRVAKEEARMVGAYFGQTFLQVGMHLEDMEHERWKKWAGSEMEKIRSEQLDAHGSSFSDDLVPDADADAETDDMTESIVNMSK
jgi:small subunit ribosomal protein S23